MNLVHQASHDLLFKNRTANAWVGRIVAAFPLLTSIKAYTCAHCRHHANLGKASGDPDKTDPKRVRYSELDLVNPGDDKARFVKLHILRPLLLWHMPSNVRGSISWADTPPSERRDRNWFWALALSIIILADLFTGTDLILWLVLFWVVPYVTTFQHIRYLGEMAEHAGLLVTDNPWMGSRSWTSWYPIEWLLTPHTDHLHLVHHLFAKIPHYRVRQAHRILLQQVPEYAAAHHCSGFFRPRGATAPSVVQDILRPEDIHRYATPTQAVGLSQQNASS